MLARGRVQALPELLLVARPSADEDYSNVGGLCGRDGSGEAGLVVRPALAALCKGNGAFGGGADALERRYVGGIVLRAVNNVVSQLVTIVSRDLWELLECHLRS